jgi:hypothetical protein
MVWEKTPLNRLISLIAVIILIVVVGGAAFLLLREDAPPTDPAVTEEPAETEETAASEEASESTAEFVAGADGYSITPAQAELYPAESDNIPTALGQPETGQQWVMLTVSLLNEASDDPVPVSADELTLFDEDDNEYRPLEEAGTISPYLVGAELTRDESLRGFVVFQTPTDAVPAIIQWCPNGSCDPALRADILLPTSEQ